MRFARKYVWPFRWEMSQSAFGMLFGILLSLVTPFLTQAMVDDGIGLRDMGLIVSIMMAQIFIFVGTFSMGLISSWVSLYMTTRINIHILSDYLTKLLRLPMTYSGRFVAENEGATGLCKILVGEDDKILGVHLLGNYSSEIITTATLAVEQELTVEKWQRCVFPHPSVSEILKETLGVFEDQDL